MSFSTKLVSLAAVFLDVTQRSTKYDNKHLTSLIDAVIYLDYSTELQQFRSYPALTFGKLTYLRICKLLQCYGRERLHTYNTKSNHIVTKKPPALSI